MIFSWTESSFSLIYYTRKPLHRKPVHTFSRFFFFFWLEGQPTRVEIGDSTELSFGMKGGRSRTRKSLASVVSVWVSFLSLFTVDLRVHLWIRFFWPDGAIYEKRSAHICLYRRRNYKETIPSHTRDILIGIRKRCRRKKYEETYHTFVV